MKKKVLGFMLATCFVASCASMVSACGNNPSSDDAKTLTKAEYAQAYAGVKSMYGDYINAETQDKSISSMSTSISDDDLVTVDRENQMERMATACVQYVGFLENLCKNDTFEIAADYRELSVVDTSASGYVGNYKLRLKMAYDAETSLITSEVYCDDGSYKMYLVFEILFNFDTSTLDYFTVTGAMGATLTANSVNYFKFKDNTLKMLPKGTETFNTYAQGIVATCDALVAAEWGGNLPDYSQEYVSAMLGN